MPRAFTPIPFIYDPNEAVDRLIGGTFLSKRTNVNDAYKFSLIWGTTFYPVSYGTQVFNNISNGGSTAYWTPSGVPNALLAVNSYCGIMLSVDSDVGIGTAIASGVWTNGSLRSGDVFEFGINLGFVDTNMSENEISVGLYSSSLGSNLFGTTFTIPNDYGNNAYRYVITGTMTAQGTSALPMICGYIGYDEGNDIDARIYYGSVSLKKLTIGTTIGTRNPSYQNYAGDSVTFIDDQYYGTAGTLQVKITRIDTKRNFMDDDIDSEYERIGADYIRKGDIWQIVLGEVYPPNNYIDQTTRIWLPKITNTTTHLWVGTKGETYYDENYAILACGYIGQRDIAEHATCSGTKLGNGEINNSELANTTDFLRYSPRKNRDNIYTTEDFETLSVRIGSVTSWNYAPEYRIFFDKDNTGVYATTNWHVNIQRYGEVSKEIRHWSGDYQIGAWNPTFQDPDNIIWGSLYTVGDARNSKLLLRARITDISDTWQTQFSGLIKRTTVEDGVLSVSIEDSMADLPTRKFVYDYACMGSHNISTGKSWGVVTRVFGTQVMFDDQGDRTYIERKQKGGKTWIDTLTGAVVGGVIGFLGGNIPGAIMGFGAGALSNLPSDGKYTNAYWLVDDYNTIPEDLVSSGQILKFYSGSVNGVATNLNGALNTVQEYTVLDGTFCQGIFATLSLSSVQGISVGDFVYVRQPMVYGGNPNEIITALLCGSNIDYPYHDGGETLYLTLLGNTIISKGATDFNDTWDEELSPYALMSLAKTVQSTDNSSPFEEMKQLCEELLFSFYLDKDNKFTIKTVKPRVFESYSSNYTENGNIIDGFSFERSTDEAISGLSFSYRYGGDIVKTNEGFLSRIDLQATNPISGVNNWGTLQSYWIQSYDDAYFTAYRYLLQKQRGMDRVSIPTTLFGVLENTANIVQVTHRSGSLSSVLFEIDKVNKSFDNSTVKLEGLNISRVYGLGNTKFSNSPLRNDPYTYNESCYSVNVPYKSLDDPSLATLGKFNTATLYAKDLQLFINNANDWDLLKYPMWNNQLLMGFEATSDLLYGKFELLTVDAITNGTAFFTRGLNNTRQYVYTPLSPSFLIVSSGFKPNKSYNGILNYFLMNTNTLLQPNLGTTPRFF